MRGAGWARAAAEQGGCGVEGGSFIRMRCASARRTRRRLSGGQVHPVVIMCEPSGGRRGGRDPASGCVSPPRGRSLRIPITRAPAEPEGPTAPVRIREKLRSRHPRTRRRVAAPLRRRQLLQGGWGGRQSSDLLSSPKGTSSSRGQISRVTVNSSSCARRSQVVRGKRGEARGGGGRSVSW